MRFPSAARLRFFGLAMVLCLFAGEANANQMIRAPRERFGRRAQQHRAMSPAEVLRAARGRAGGLSLEVKGRRRFMRLGFARHYGKITLHEGKLYVDGARQNDVKPGKLLKTAGRRFEVVEYDADYGILKLRRPGREELIVVDQYGFDQADNLAAHAFELGQKAYRHGDPAVAERANTALVSAHVNDAAAHSELLQPTLDFVEKDRRVWYSGGIVRRWFNRIPLVNWFTGAYKNPIQRLMGGRLARGKSSLLRRTFWRGKESPQGLLGNLAGRIFWKDLGRYYLGKEQLGDGIVPGTIELNFADGTRIIDSPALGEGNLPDAHWRWTSWIFGKAAIHERLIQVERRMSQHDKGWMKLSTGWYWNQTDIRLSPGG